MPTGSLLGRSKVCVHGMWIAAVPVVIPALLGSICPVDEPTTLFISRTSVLASAIPCRMMRSQQLCTVRIYVGSAISGRTLMHEPRRWHRRQSRV
eukprot:scaffold376894_cov26-Prasinocladus_malaysianus.AAC.1